MSIFVQCALRDFPGYPMHRHEHTELIQFLQGEGTLYTKEKRFHYQPGTIILLPPGTEHGSESESPTQRFWLQADLPFLPNLSGPVVCSDNSEGEGAALCRMILRNQFGDPEYLDSLCTAYGRFALHDLRLENDLTRAVEQVIRRISAGCADPEFSTAGALRETGYAEDYIRAHFHARTGKTPGQFLTELRIRQARELMEIYGDGLTLSQVAEQCGYTDYVYFSRRFRQITGLSPRQWKSRA